MIKFPLSPQAKEAAFHYTRQKARVVGKGGSHINAVPSNVPATNKKQTHRQSLGMLGEVSFAMAMAGHNEGIRLFSEEREYRDLHAGIPDGGNDVFADYDVKSRQIERHKRYFTTALHKDPLNYALLLRRGHLPIRKASNVRDSQRYVCVLLDVTDETLDTERGSVVAWVVGWDYFKDIPYYCKRRSQTIFG